MTRNLLTFTAVLILIVFVNSSSSGGQLAPELRDFILQTNPHGYTPVIVLLTDRVDTKSIVESMTASHATLAKRHEVVVTELRNKADRTQGVVIDKIKMLKKSGEIKEYTPLWVSNMIGMTAKLSAIDEIANMHEVEVIVYDTETELIKPVDESPDKPGGMIQSVETGLEAIRADEVWAMGITGQGVLVSSLDTGVDGNHPAVYDRWRGHDPRYQNNPEWAWHDPLTFTTFPFDAGSHGTHTMGTICGRSTSSDDTIGVAIDAEWISAGVVDRGGNLPTRMLRYLIAFQWTMDPDSNPATFWDVPVVCSNSWGHYPGSMPGGDCDDWYWETLSNMEAAGVCVVFAAGNEGNIGLRNPAVRATDDYNSFSVGAVDGNNPSFPIAGFSSRGPSYCTPDGSAAIKPEVSAPGVDVRSSVPGNGYSTGSGTSMACPHVGGVVALIKQANPNLPPEMIKQILMDTAYDLGPTGEDNDYGWGIIDAYEAVQMAISLLEGWGTIRGRVTDYHTGYALDATITITNRNPEITAVTNTEGYYTMLVPADTLWELRCEAFSEEYLPDSVTVSVTSGDTTFQNFALRYPDVTIDMVPLNTPIIVPAGGYFTFIGILNNNTSEAQTTDVWIMLDVPGYGMYGPIQQFNNIHLEPDQQLIVWNVMQNIPVYAPTGIYEYIGYNGDYPSEMMDMTSFEFRVYGSAGGGADTWNLGSWFDDISETKPSEYALIGNYPNPFNAQTNISFDIPVAGQTTIEVYNLAGQKAETLIDSYLEAGNHTITWNASNYSSGIYFYKLTAGDKVFTKRMTLLK